MEKLKKVEGGVSMLLWSSEIKEVVEEIKKDMNVPDGDVILIVHVGKKDVERVCGALELSGVIKQLGAIGKFKR